MSPAGEEDRVIEITLGELGLAILCSQATHTVSLK